MSIEDLKSEIEKIVEFTESIPEMYRQKCFDFLINQLSTKRTAENIPDDAAAAIMPEIENSDFQIPIEVRALFRQFKIEDDRVYEMFLITGKEEIAPIYKISTTVKSKAQIQICLLTALENALKNGSFEFSKEEVRQRCKDGKVYDTRNFVTHFANSAKFFKNLEEEKVALSPYGKEKLIEIINAL